MKKIYLNSIVTGLALIFISFPSAIFSQAKWGLPIVVNIYVPVKMSSGSSDNIPPSGHSSNGFINSSIGIKATLTKSTQLKSYNQNNDTIDIEYYDPSSPWLTNETYYHFVIDTSLRKIRDFSWSFHYDYEATEGNDKTNANIAFLPLSYIMLPDSTLIVHDSGMICRDNITSIGYTSSDYRTLDPQHGTYSLSGQMFDSLLNDTSSYKCFLNISLYPPKPNSIVQSSKKLNPTLLIFTSIFNHSIHFSFPSSDHSQSLSIYDILGREVKRIEIPSGVSEYNLQRDGFMSGYYFARLGSQSASFIVN